MCSRNKYLVVIFLRGDELKKLSTIYRTYLHSIPYFLFLYYFYACPPTVRTMSFNVDHSQHSRKKKSPETMETYAQGLSTF